VCHLIPMKRLPLRAKELAAHMCLADAIFIHVRQAGTRYELAREIINGLKAAPLAGGPQGYHGVSRR